MTNAVGINSIVTGAGSANPVPVPPPASSSNAPSSAAPAGSIQNLSISPRIVDDPSAGLLIQYLDSKGQVETQIPSTRVVAYLKAGLTAEGLSKQPLGQTA